MDAGTGWWRDAVGYEVYVRSFADGDGDGIGDLPGVLARLDHLAELGVGIVWLTPCYPSPQRDHGYDVADYTAIAPEYGTMADLDALVAAVHARGMRLLLDLVPNHTSSDHPWFVAARSRRDDPHRDFYVWRDPAPDGGPPNNWVSHFGGPAWTYDERTGQYWLHLFLPEQPDLNWRHPAVADAFEDILRFWFARGVDGFRIDVAHALVKHPDLPDQPPAAVGEEEIDLGSAASDWETLEHPYDSDQPGVLDVYRRWRRVADEYGALLLGEVYILEPDGLARYLGGDGLHAAFWFRVLHMPWTPASLRRVLAEGVRVTLAQPGDVAWVQGSHDRSRAVRRYGGGAVGRARALAMATLELFLPGLAFLYQGEELGLDDPVLAPEDAQDPIAVRAGEVERGRDVARTPLPWAPGPGMGFTTADRPWLPFGERTPEDTVAVQRGDPASPLSTHRRLLAVRRALAPLDGAPFAWLDPHADVIAFRRGDVVVAANVGEGPVPVALADDGWTVCFGTDPARDGTAGGSLMLAAAEAVVLAPSP
jgi:alpha-glucosidase